MADRKFPIAETDDYVRKILGNAGKVPDGTPEEVVDFLLPHVIHQESGGNPNAVSRVGALGRLQVMPATAANPGFGIKPAADHSPAELERVGKAYLTALVARYPGRPDLALAAYNAGPGRADKWAAREGAPVNPTAPAGGAPEGLQSLFRASSGAEGITPLAPDWGELRRASDEPQAGTLGDYFTDVVGLDSSVGAIARIYEDHGYAVDPNFDIGAIPKKEWEQITAGIPEELQGGLGGAASRAHLEILAARTRAQLRAEEELAAYGGWGVAGRFALNLLDPLNVGLAVFTGGIGDIGVAATRLRSAAMIATRAGKFADAGLAVRSLESLAKSGAWKNAAKVGLAAGAENAGVEYLLDRGNLTRDGWDVANAGLAGLMLGAGASRVFRGRQLAEVRDAYLRTRDALKLAELDHHISTRRAELDVKLKWLHADADVARAQEAIRAHKADLEVAYQARRQALTQTAAGALKRSELGALRRETEGLRKQMKGADRLEAQIRERMFREDTAAMGAEASTKARRRMREKAAKKEAASRIETIRSNLQRAETALARGQAAEDARVELRRLERRDKSHPGDRLSALSEPERNRFGEREQALVASLGQAEGRVATRRAALEAEIADLEKVRQAGVQAIDKATVADLQVFGKDTASSARFGGFYEGVHPHLEDADTGLPVIPQMGARGARGKVVSALTARKGPLATIAMVLRGSPDEVVRTELGRMVGNSVGNVEGAVNTAGGSEIAHILRQRMAAKFYSAATPAYKDWAERNGIGFFGRQTRLAREDFMSAVGRAIRGDTDQTDPAVLKAAGEVRKVFAEYLAEAKAAGVKGFENVEQAADYLPRVFDFKSQAVIERRIGSDNLRTLIRGAILSANEDLPEKVAETIAYAYLRRMKELRVGSDVGLLQGVKWDDIGFLRRFLSEAGVAPKDTLDALSGVLEASLRREGMADEQIGPALEALKDRLLDPTLTPAEVESVIDKFAAVNARRQRQTEGTFRNAKHRVQFDENYTLRFKDQDALREGRDEDVEVRMADLFENNVEALFGRYNRSVSGHIGLAKVGMKSKDDFDHSITLVERALEHDPKELERVKKTALATYQLITGTPIEDASELTRLGRAMRDWNFTTTMGQSGWAQFPDLAGLLQKGYFMHTMKSFPEIFGAARRRVDGRIDDAFYRELEEWLGLGTDLHNNQVFSSFDWGEEGEGLSGVLGKTEHGLRVAGRGVQIASGLGWMTQMSQRMAGRAILQRLVKDVMDDGGSLAEHRALQLGLDGAMKKRISDQLRAHTEFANGDFGGKVRIVNYAKWTDVDARDAMLQAISREARRLVQEEDLGDTALWMHTHLGKLITQFRRFAMVSYSKQLLHGIAHADAEEATRVMISGALAAMAYQARHMTKVAQMELGGASDEDIEDYKSKFLSTDRLVAATIANSTYSSVLPGLWDSSVGMLTGERFFNVRNSEQASDFITGNPTVSTGLNLYKAIGGGAQALIRGDRQLNQSTTRAARRLVPFENVLGMDLPYTALTADLPQGNDDPDPDAIDWFLNDTQ